MRTILIDDQRNLKADATARTYKEGIELLKSEKWDLLLLDHDLGCFDENNREWNGYHVMCWLEENVEFLPGKIEIVSSNPEGRRRIQQVINKLYGRLKS